MIEAAAPPSTSRRARARRWLKRLSESPHALRLLFVLSFAESIFFAIPIELVVIPYMLANRGRLWRIALVATLGGVAASVVVYAIGYFLFETVGWWLVTASESQEAFARVQGLFAAHGFWAIVLVGVSPIPFQVVVLIAGAAHYPLALFVLAAAVARGVRYFGLGLLVRVLGDRALYLWRHHRLKAAALAAAILALVLGVSYWLGAIAA